MKTRSEYIEVDSGLKIHAEIVGSGEPILCIPGFAYSNSCFYSLAEILSKKFQLVMIDNRGMGKSEHADADYEFAEIARDAISVMDKLGCKKYSVLGISMGGYVAQDVAKLVPDRVKSLCLIATKSGGPEYPVTFAVTEEGFTAFYNMDPVIGNEMAVQKYVDPSFIEEKPEEYKKIVQMRWDKDKDVNLEQALKQLRSAYGWLDEDKKLNEIEIPTAIITGQNDAFITPENGEIMHKHIPNSTLHIVEKTAHLLFFEKPEEVSNIIENLLEKAND